MRACVHTRAHTHGLMCVILPALIANINNDSAQSSASEERLHTPGIEPRRAACRAPRARMIKGHILFSLGWGTLVYRNGVCSNV